VESLCWNCDFEDFLFLFLCILYVLCVLLSAANGVINDDDIHTESHCIRLTVYNMQ